MRRAETASLLLAKLPNRLTAAEAADRLERAFALAAYVVVRHGEAYAPLFDRLEAELRSVRRASAPVERARRVLQAYTVEGGVKAII